MYGQGMAVAARHALILRDRLAHGPHNIRDLRAAIARACTVAWYTSVISDLRIPWIEGRRPPLTRLANAYSSRLFRAARHDPVVTRTFLRAAHLVDPPSRVVRPGMLLRVLAGGGRSPKRRARRSPRRPVKRPSMSRDG